MISYSFTAVALRLVFFGSFISAQSTSGDVSIPSDLSGGFQPDEVTLQVSFTNQSDNGFQSGSDIPQSEVGTTPVFALGDASGVNTEIQYTIFMVDTTSSDNRVLHYVHSNFKATEVKTGISSSTNPELPWQAPGSLGDTGPGRAYTFLLYEQHGPFPNNAMPALGQNVSVQDFAKANNLPKAVAGIVMQVDVSGAPASGSGSSTTASVGSGNQAGSVGAVTTVVESVTQPTAAPTTVVAPTSPQGAAGAIESAPAVASTTVASGSPTTIATAVSTVALTASNAVVPSGTSTVSAAVTSPASGLASKKHTASWGYSICAGILAFAGALAF